MDNVIKILRCSVRTSAELFQLEDVFFHTYSFIRDLKRQLETEFYQKIFQELKIERHLQYETLFEAGEIGRKIYFILAGSVAIFLPYSSTSKAVPGAYNSLEELVEQKYKEFRWIKTLNAGTYFGEVALQNKCPRTASVVAAEDLYVATLTYDIYQRIIRQAQLQINEEKLGFLRKVTLFEGWDEAALLIIMRNCEEKEYKPLSFVYRYNEPLDYVYFIKQGEIRLSVYKYVLEDDILHRKKKEVLSISNLTNFQYFGELEVFQQIADFDQKEQLIKTLAKATRSSDAFTQTHCKLLRLSMQQFVDNYQIFSNLERPKKMFLKVHRHRSSMQEIRSKIVAQKQFILNTDRASDKPKAFESSSFHRVKPTIPVRLRVQTGQVTQLDYSTIRSKSNGFFRPGRLKQIFGYTQMIPTEPDFTYVNCSSMRLSVSRVKRKISQR